MLRFLSLSSGLLLCLKTPSLFRAVSCFQALVCPSKFSSLFRAACWLFSNSPVVFRAVCSFCSDFFERFAPLSAPLEQFALFFKLFSRTLVSFEGFAPGSQFAQSLSSGLLLVLKFSNLIGAVRSWCSQVFLPLSSGLYLVLEFSSLFRAACSLFSNSLLSFERFAPCSQFLYSLRAVCPCSQIP